MVNIDGKFKVVLFGSAPNEMGELVDSSILFDFEEEAARFEVFCCNLTNAEPL